MNLNLHRRRFQDQDAVERQQGLACLCMEGRAIPESMLLSYRNQAVHKHYSLSSSSLCVCVCVLISLFCILLLSLTKTCGRNIGLLLILFLNFTPFYFRYLMLISLLFRN